MAKQWLLTATGWLLCHSLAGCGGIDGARYTVDGTATFTAPDTPSSDMTLYVWSVWTDDGSGFHPLGGTENGTRSGQVTVPIGPWAPTANPATYTFQTVAEVPIPDEADSPVSVSLTVYSPTESMSAYGTVSAHEVGEEDDGWIPIHVRTEIDTSSWW
jgi:hypothetical protein